MGQSDDGLQRPCHACNAKPGESCRTTAGQVAERVHWGRPRAIEYVQPESYSHPAYSTPHRDWVDTRKPCGAGVTACGDPGRLYACGWRCDAHRPSGPDWAKVPSTAEPTRSA